MSQSPSQHSAPPPSVTEHEGGLVGRQLERLFGRSWKTSLTGLITILCGVIPLIPGIPPQVVQVAGVILPVIVGGGLMAAKDKAVSGLNKPGSPPRHLAAPRDHAN